MSSRALKSDVEAGFLKNVKEAAEVVKDSSNGQAPAVQALNALMNTYAVKKVADVLSESIKTEMGEKEQQQQEEGKKKKKGDLLSALFLLKRKDLIDDDTFRMLVMLAMFNNEGDGNMLLPLMLSSSSQQQKPSDDTQELKKVLKTMAKRLKRLEEKVNESKQSSSDTEQQKAVQAMTQTDLMKSIIESQNQLVTNLLTSLLTNNKQNALDDLQKLADVMAKLRPETDGTQNLIQTIDLLQKLGLVSDKYKEKLLDLKKEIIQKKLETEAKLEEMRLEREKLKTQAEIAVAQKNAETIKSMGDLIIKSVTKGVIESFKPSPEAQKSNPPPPPQQQQSPQQPPPPPKPVEEIEVQHVNDKGEVLHSFKIPVDVLKKNETTIENEKYYKIICPYDNAELYLPVEQLEKNEEGGENNG